MPDLTAKMLATLQSQRYRYVRFTRDGLQACKHNGDTAKKKEWEDIDNEQGVSVMRLPSYQELDLDSL